MKLRSIVAALLISVLCTFSAFAENIPDSLVLMSDGGYFDPGYFAQTYPDLVANIGTDINTEYQHYLKYGQCQGLKPFSDETATKIQSLTYQPGNIVVPASVKAHPEGIHTLVYSDDNVDIYYSSISSGSSLLNKKKKTALCFYVVNKTSEELSMYGDALSINNQMRKDTFSAKIFANASSEERCLTDYPDEEFDNISCATFQVKYRVGENNHNYETARFNLIFYH